jgi:hypothetical protein
MGGSGSDYPIWKDKKYTVEDCLKLDINKLVRDRLVGPWNASGNLIWTNMRSGE